MCQIVNMKLFCLPGRNVALKQQTEMISFYHEESAITGFKNISFTADLVVDGNTSQDFYEGRSCARTNNAFKPFWRVTLSRPALVNRFVIYNRDGRYTTQLTLTRVLPLSPSPKLSILEKCTKQGIHKTKSHTAVGTIALWCTW